MKTILFVPCYDGHIRVFAPVIERLKEQGKLEPLVVFLEQTHGAKLLEVLNGNNLPYLRFDLPSYTAEGGKRGLITRAQNALKFARFLLAQKREVSRLFDKLNPAFVVTVTDGFQNDAYFLYEARRRGIPSLCLYSVMTSPVLAEEVKRVTRLTLLNRLYRKGLMLLGLPINDAPAPSRGYASKLAVWSEKHREALLARGGDSGKIAVTGSPAHDLIHRMLKQQSEEALSSVREALGIAQDKNIFLFASQPVASDRFCTFDEQQRLTELIVETCARFGQYTLVIKLHPRESIKDYTYLDNHPLRDRFLIVSEQEADLYDLILAARVMITQCSSTAMDAILFNKDIVIVDTLITIKDPMSYIESGAAAGVYREEELFDTLDKILNDESMQKKLQSNRERFTAEYTYKFDGKSADRVIELIGEMLNQQGT